MRRLRRSHISPHLSLHRAGTQAFEELLEVQRAFRLFSAYALVNLLRLPVQALAVVYAGRDDEGFL